MIFLVMTSDNERAFQQKGLTMMRCYTMVKLLLRDLEVTGSILENILLQCRVKLRIIDPSSKSCISGTSCIGLPFNAEMLYTLQNYKDYMQVSPSRISDYKKRTRMSI